MHFDIRRKKPENILQIKKSECKLLQVIHILKRLDSETSVKTYKNYLLMQKKHITSDKHFMEVVLLCIVRCPVIEGFEFM